MLRTACGILALALSLYAFYSRIRPGDQFPKLRDKWWGEGYRIMETHYVEDSRIEVTDKVLYDLQNRLKATQKLHPSYLGMGQRYGIRDNVMQDVLDYWTNHYNFTKRLEFINQYPHRFVKIRGLTIHFLYAEAQRKHQNTRVIPLLMVHGWPSSFLEFYEVLPMLVKSDPTLDFVFEVVAPSIPGFAFSDYPHKPGMSAIYIAQIFAELMEILEYDHYYVHGGDWGGVIIQHMAHRYPHRVLGMHSTMCYVNTITSNLKFIIGSYLPSLIYEPEEMRLWNKTANSIAFMVEEGGYFHLQATKPDTIGMALRDSPIGLAAYMLEKFSTLTNANYRDREDGGLTEKFTMEQLLDNVMVYWVTRCMTSAMRIYAEAITNYELEFNRYMRILVPAGCARFPNEILLSPRYILKERYTNLVHLTTYNNGGHFAAMEVPGSLAYDITSFVEKVEKMRPAKKRS
ncbi:hypothetical protein GWI33_007536 [Rhynchophorus ferrugineus]|uniref:Epoxide hydrolase n=1 Tax=Rhynchophorus ferrugineus TaxID=354439 RepID=A0A834IJS4_RHYFE|nr:hypothetical protein GWI33_007536 [Rhynchophorus ferrugineus]